LLAVPMSSRRRSRDNPIESVALKLTFRADRKTSALVKRSIPAAVIRKGACEIKIEGSLPEEVAAKAKEVLERVHAISESAERI